MKKFNVVSNSISSINGKAIMMGCPCFTDDFADKNSLIIKILRSPHAFAKIKNIDTSKAEKLPGVVLVLTHKNVPHIPFTRAEQSYPEPSPIDKFILDEYVRYVGDEVAAIAALNEETATKALELIEVDYEVMEPVLDFEKAKNNKSIIHPEDGIKEMFPIGFEPKNNVASSYSMHIGNVEEELKKCDYVVEETFYSQAQAHAMLEPHTCNARLDEYNRLVIYSSTQAPFHIRRIVAKSLCIPIEKIRVIKPHVGGSFGGKQALHGEMFVALTTLRTGMPSKIVFTREEVFESSYTRHPMRVTVKMGATKDGHIRVIDCNALSDTGAYGEGALTVFMNLGSKVLPLYNKVKAVRFSGDVVYTNHVSAGAFRGYGAIQGNFAVESTIDVLAEKMGVDPIKLREDNSIKEKETSPIFEIMGEGRKGTPMIMESCKLPYCIKRGRQLIGWDDKYPRKQVGPHLIRSVGMAIAMQGSGIPFIHMGSTTIKLNDGGSYMVTVGAVDVGQGSDTVISQIVAETLNTTVDKVIIYSADTDLTPYDCGAFASSSTYVSGNAAYRAASKMRELLIKEASLDLGVKPETIIFDGKTFISGTKSVSLEDLSTKRLYNSDTRQIAVTESYHSHVCPPPFIAGYAEIEIDTETYEYKLLNYVSVVDCGTIINPELVKSQVEGGIIQGFGMTAYEDVKYTPKGKLLSNSFDTYHIPTRMEVNNLITEFADSYEVTGPFGAKSVGEVCINTPPAAICNAIYNALGVRLHKLPITPESIFEAVKKIK